MTSFLRDAQPVPADPSRATITKVNSDGTVTIDLGAGQEAPNTIVLASASPTLGDTVEVMRRDEAHWVVLGGRRYAPPATQAITVAQPASYDAYGAVVAANPLVANVVGTGSWRDADGWSGAYLPTTDTVAQGRYNSTFGYYHGCYFYGNPFTGLSGRSCVRLRIRVNRLGSGGSAGGTQQVIGPHPHPTQPDGQPAFPWGALNAGSIAWSTAAVLDLPVEWGNLLITGAAFGFGHFLYATGNGNQSYAAGIAADSATGQITLDWV